MMVEKDAEMAEMTYEASQIDPLDDLCLGQHYQHHSRYPGQR